MAATQAVEPRRVITGAVLCRHRQGRLTLPAAGEPGRSQQQHDACRDERERGVDEAVQERDADGPAQILSGTRGEPDRDGELVPAVVEDEHAAPVARLLELPHVALRQDVPAIHNR